MVVVVDRPSHRRLILSKPVLLLLVLAVTGCGGAAEKAQDADPVGNVTLKALCPGVHKIYDELVASNPESQTAFVDHLEDLRKAADAQARDALDPLIKGAKELAAAGRGPDFSVAQDAMYQGVVGLDASCRKAGSFILH